MLLQGRDFSERVEFAKTTGKARDLNIVLMPCFFRFNCRTERFCCRFACLCAVIQVEKWNRDRKARAEIVSLELVVVVKLVVVERSRIAVVLGSEDEQWANLGCQFVAIRLKLT